MKCPYCRVKMQAKKDLFGSEQIEFEEFQCPKCGEELLTMDQLKELGEKHKQWRNAQRVKFSKWGNSIGIRIPQEVITQLHIKAGGIALVKTEKNSIKIVPA